MPDDQSAPFEPNALDISPQDRDLAIRTMIGEEKSPVGVAGVASVILNRATSGRYGGNSISGVITMPNQFDSWNNPTKLLAIKPSDPGYQMAGKIFDGIASGEISDPTGGATHFYAPGPQAAAGRPAPSWAKGVGTALGSTLFFAPNGPTHYQAPASNAIEGAISNADDHSTLTIRPDQQSDPFSDYPTADAPSSWAGSLPTTVPGASNGSQQAATGSSASPAAASVSGDPFDEYPTAAAPSAPTAPVANPVAGPLNGASSVANASATGVASGIPVIGPYVNEGLDRGVAAIMSLATGKPYANALAAEQARQAQDVTAHPTVNALSQAVGAVAGTVPMAVLAPEFFGIGEGGLVGNALLSGATGAALGGADAGVRSGGNLNAVKQGAITGAAFGALAPFAGKAVGSGINALSNVLSRTTPAARNVAGVLSDIGMTPQQAGNALTRIGPNAVLADINPALTTEAGGLAATGGSPTSILKNAMAARAAGADDRASQAVTAALGPKPDLTASVEAIENDAATRAGPSYTAGRGGAPMDVTPILANIDAKMPNASGSVANVLNTVKSYLTNKVASSSNPAGLAVPKDDPGSILGARQALDDLIQKMPLDTSAGKNAANTAIDLRKQIDAVVKTNPDFAAGDAIYAKAMGVRDALQQGADAFKNSTRPEDMNRAIQAMTPEEQDAYRQGARVAIGDAMENARRGEYSGAQSMFGRGTSNRAKLDSLFPGAQDVFDALHGEATMRTTEQRVAGNSATAEREAVKAKYAPKSGNAIGAAPAVVGEAFAGGPGAVAATALRAAYGHASNALMEGTLNRLRLGTARGLVAQGPELQEFLGQIERAHRTNAVTNALVSGGSAATNLLTRGAGNALQQQFLPQHQ